MDSGLQIDDAVEPFKIRLKGYNSDFLQSNAVVVYSLSYLGTPVLI